LLKATIDAWTISPRPWLRAIARGLRTAGAARRFLFHPQIRSEQITRALHRDQHLQGATYTEADRYPELFAACRTHLANVAAPTILSFGCATGQEVFSLADYLPRATITGVDINRWCLRQCVRANRNPKLKFLHAADRRFVADPPFDAIFAMAVFQRTEHRTERPDVITGGFTFARFAEEIARLDLRLKPGGLLFIGESDFRFVDTATALHYVAMDFEGNEVLEQRPLFGSDNRLIAEEYKTHRGFMKRNGSVQG
jgi:SAM-dependent methyltransferase